METRQGAVMSPTVNRRRLPRGGVRDYAPEHRVRCHQSPQTGMPKTQKGPPIRLFQEKRMLTLTPPYEVDAKPNYATSHPRPVDDPRSTTVTSRSDDNTDRTLTPQGIDSTQLNLTQDDTAQRNDTPPKGDPTHTPKDSNRSQGGRKLLRSRAEGRILTRVDYSKMLATTKRSESTLTAPTFGAQWDTLRPGGTSTNFNIPLGGEPSKTPPLQPKSELDNLPASKSARNNTSTRGGDDMITPT